MAEALAVIGLVAAIVQFVDFGGRVVARLNEAQEEIRNGPKVFLDIRHRIPLMLDLLKRTQAQISRGQITTDAQETMLPVMESCLTQIKALEKHMAKAIPQKGDSSWTRGRKALISVVQEGELRQIDGVLKMNFELMVQAGTFHSLARIESRENSISTITHNTMNVSVMSPMSPVDLEERLQGMGIGAAMGLSSSPPPAYADMRGAYEPMGEKREMKRRGSVVFMMQYPRDPKFLAREGVIDSIEEKFKTQSQVALAGLGGVGKTQLAIEYGYVFKERNPGSHVFWIFAGTSARFEQGYQDIARRLSLPGWDDDQVDTLKLVHDWLNNEQDLKYLLLIDNADDSSVFWEDKSRLAAKQPEGTRYMAQYLPQNPNGSILVTTRDKRVGERLGGREKPIEIETMSQSDSLSLLRSKMPDDDCDDPDALKLVSDLAYLPLAITQAAAFMSENCLTISEYLDLLSTGDADIAELISEDMVDPRRDLLTENSVMRTWKLSFDLLSKTKPRAADILSLMSVLEYNNIPRDLLRLPQESELTFRTNLAALQAFSLITTSKPIQKGAPTTCRMHRLVALSTQKWLGLNDSLGKFRSEALRALENRFPFRPTYAHWQLLETLTPHAALIYGYPYTEKEDVLALATLLASSSLYDLGRGKYADADAKCVRSLKLREEQLGEEHELTLESSQVLGETLLHETKFTQAKEMLLRTIRGREKALGPLHADTLESCSDLANTLIELDELEEAEVMALRALTGREEVLGEGHYEVFVSLNIYGMVLIRTGRVAEAREVLERALKGREKLLGWDNPDTLIVLNNLGVVELKEERLEEAKKSFERCVEGEERLIGVECYDVQVSLSNLGDLLVEMKDLEGADKCFRRVLETREKVLGKEHACTLWSAGKLASALRLNGEESMKEVKQLDARVERGKRTSIGRAGALTTAGLLFD